MFWNPKTDCLKPGRGHDQVSACQLEMTMIVGIPVLAPKTRDGLLGSKNLWKPAGRFQEISGLKSKKVVFKKY